MALTAGIVGLPNVGKSTLFNAITKAGAEAANYPFATIDPNVGMVEVPDERLQKLTELITPKKTVPTTFEFTDIAGIVKGASKGEGLGNKFLANIREVDAIVHVVRAFDDENVMREQGREDAFVDPMADIDTINLELILADLESINKRYARVEKVARTQKDKDSVAEFNVLQKIKPVLEDGKSARTIEFTEDEYKKYRQALEFIFQVRNALHNIARKKQDQVTFDILPDLSSKLGFKNKPRYTKDRLCMSKILSCLHIIHNFTATMVKKFTRQTIFEASNIPKLRQLRFKKNLYIIEDTLYCSFYRKEQTLNSVLKELIELPVNVEKFDRSYIYFASRAKLPKVQTKELKKSIKTILSKPNLYHLIKLIYNAGLFQAVLPSTKMIIDQPQFDGYHRHPVDIHSIKTLKYSQNIEDTYIKSIFDDLTNEQKIIVRLVAFFHDIGKGRSDDHHIVGEKLFKSMMKSFDFSEEFIKLGARIVRYHNRMSYIATHEDIYSEKTILNFTGLITSKEALKMLYVVTYCDISAVGKNVFNKIGRAHV